MYSQTGKENCMGDRTDNNKIRNTKPKDSGAKLIFDNHILCAQLLRGYRDVEPLRKM